MGTYALYVVLVAIGVNYNLSLVFEYSIGICSGYLMNKNWTFIEQEHGRNSFVKYCITYLSSFLVNAIILNFLVIILSMSPIIGQFFALVFSTCLSFIAQNLWVFKKNKNI
jgi:putative flippase GtrA